MNTGIQGVYCGIECGLWFAENYNSIYVSRVESRCVFLETRLRDVLKMIFSQFYNESVSLKTIGVLVMHSFRLLRVMRGVMFWNRVYIDCGVLGMYSF